jgi:hypothetical protein
LKKTPSVLKIEIIRESPSEVCLSLAGRIGAVHLPELARLIAEASGRRIVLDVAAVTLPDRAAVVFLACGPGSRAELRGCSPFLRQWIRAEAAEQARQRVAA